MSTDPVEKAREWLERCEAAEAATTALLGVGIGLEPLTDGMNVVRGLLAEQELTKRLLTEMQRHIDYHDLLRGRCAAWGQLKKLHGVIED